MMRSMLSGVTPWCQVLSGCTHRTGPPLHAAKQRTRLRLTLRAKRLGLSLTEAKEIIDLYESPRDSGAQLQKFLQVLAEHRQQLEERMQDIQLTLDEVRAQEKEAQQLLRKLGTREST